MSHDKAGTSFRTAIEAFLIAAIGTISFACGSCLEEHRMKCQATEANVAEWRIDPKSGERSFHYLSPQPEQP